MSDNEIKAAIEIERMIASTPPRDGLVPTYWHQMQHLACLRMEALQRQLDRSN